MARMLFLLGLLLAPMQSGYAQGSITNGPWEFDWGSAVEGPATYEQLFADPQSTYFLTLKSYSSSGPGGTVKIPASLNFGAVSRPVRVLAPQPRPASPGEDRSNIWMHWLGWMSPFDNAGRTSPVTAVVIPNSVRTIKSYTFVNLTNLVSVSIPTSVTDLGGSAFWGCSKLANIVIPNSVRVISDSTFAGCRSLTNVSIPSSVTAIGGRAFAGCSNLPSITIPDSVASLGDEAFTLCRKLTNVLIPGSVKSVGSRAFASCSGLTNLTLSSGVAWIGNEAFVGCSKLASVTIPASVTSLGNEVFSGCKALTSVYFQGNAPTAGTDLFKGISPVGKVFYPAGARGWGSSFGGWPTQVYTPPAAPAPTPSVSNTNLSSSRSSAILAGELNLVSGDTTNSAIVGGLLNTIRSKAVAASIAGGNANTAGGFYIAIGGGQLNFALANFATVGGGVSNAATGAFAVVPGGARSKATNNGAFVWSGTDAVDTVSTNAKSFTVRAPGGVRFITTEATSGLGIYNPNTPSNPLGFTNGVGLAPNGVAWMTLSDSNAKTGVKNVDPREILSKLEHMPVTEWEYKHDPHRRYFGPMAQDFHALFGLGNDDKTINTLDADGVLFLSVKGLAEELKERDKTIEELKARNEELSRNIEAINERLNSLPPSP